VAYIDGEVGLHTLIKSKGSTCNTNGVHFDFVNFILSGMVH
jgi:hypothetical protein